MTRGESWESRVATYIKQLLALCTAEPEREYEYPDISDNNIQNLLIFHKWLCHIHQVSNSFITPFIEALHDFLMQNALLKPS